MQLVNQRPGLLLHILRYATGNAVGSIPFYFPIITCMQQFTARVLFKRTAQKSALKRHVRKFSDDFHTLPKISKDFPRFLKNNKNI